MALVEHLELQRARVGEPQRLEPGAPLERLVGEAVAADHDVPSRRSRASPAGRDDAQLVRQERDELRQRDDRRVGEAGAPERLERGPVAATRIGRQRRREVQHRRQCRRGRVRRGRASSPSRAW
jgi:hypothetical protein